MRRLALLGLASVAALATIAPVEAQTRRTRDGAVILDVRPRSYLDAGNVVPVGSLSNYATAGVQSYLISPPYIGQRDRFGEGTLPDPIGIMPGARNPFGPIDFLPR